MTKNNTLVRSLHDIGAAGWFGSVLMAAVATNRAVGEISDPVEVGRVTNGVWRRWRPVNAGLVAAHLVGATGLLLANKGRVGMQKGVGSSSVAKTAVTAAALGASVYSGLLGKRIDAAGAVPMDDATTPSSHTPDNVAGALEQQAVLQWLIPALTAGIIVLGALQGEQQRPVRVVSGILDRLNPAN